MKKKKTALQRKGLSVNVYGYDYSRTDFSLTLCAIVFGMWLVCYLHKLDMFYTVIVMATTALAVPVLIRSYFKYKYEKNKFEEYCRYFEYVVIYFKSNKKIKLALEETIKLFDEKSHMRKCIQKAIDEINKTGDYKLALSYIDEDYHTSYLDRLHHLLITGEEHGAESVYKGLNGIDFSNWKDDISLHQNKKKGWRYMLYFMTVFSFGLSLYGANLFNDPLMNLSDDPQFHMSTFLNIEAMLLLFIYVYVNMVNKKWLRSDD